MCGDTSDSNPEILCGPDSWGLEMIHVRFMCEGLIGCPNCGRVCQRNGIRTGNGPNGIRTGKTQQKLYFTTVLDLEHQWTPLTTWCVAHFWKQTFRVVWWQFVNGRSQPLWSRQGHLGHVAIHTSWVGVLMTLRSTFACHWVAPAP